MFNPFRAFSTILTITVLALLANLSTIAEIERWTKLHFSQLRQIVRFRKNRTPSDNTIARILQHLSLDELQAAFAAFLNALQKNEITVAAVDGKTAKEMKDENGDPIFMLNVFAQTLKLHLASGSVHGDKTNEPGCLKQHLEELFTMYPSLKLLTGDAIYAQRPLLEAIRERFGVLGCRSLLRLDKEVLGVKWTVRTSMALSVAR